MSTCIPYFLILFKLIIGFSNVKQSVKFHIHYILTGIVVQSRNNKRTRIFKYTKNSAVLHI